jgi:hypothetical protein
MNWDVITSNRKDLERDVLNLCKKTEDLKEKNLQLEEKVQVLLAEKEATQLSMEELQRKLEITEAQMLQSSSQMRQTLARCTSSERIRSAAPKKFASRRPPWRS